MSPSTLGGRLSALACPQRSAIASDRKTKADGATKDREAAGGNDGMDVGMKKQFARPGAGAPRI
jgi:hypothetical protein